MSPEYPGNSEFQLPSDDEEWTSSDEDLYADNHEWSNQDPSKNNVMDLSPEYPGNSKFQLPSDADENECNQRTIAEQKNTDSKQDPPKNNEDLYAYILIYILGFLFLIASAFAANVDYHESNQRTISKQKNTDSTDSKQNPSKNKPKRKYKSRMKRKSYKVVKFYIR